MRTSRLVATLGPAFLLACATTRPQATDVSLAARVQGPGLLFEVLYSKADERELARIESGLLAVGPRLSRWGSFREGVWIRVFPDHESLERAVDRRGYPWLRAWAYGDQVLLQSPRSWNASEPIEEELNELLTHELTHVLMYQLLQPEDEPVLDAVIEEPPLWFREGMASVTAGQGHRRLSSEDLSHWLAAHPGADLLHPKAELYRTEKEAVYGAAHRAFDLLVRICGDQGVRDVLRGVRTGARFADAFKAATGRSLSDFEQQTIRTGFAALPISASGAGGP
ncbi:MAG: hypothetical protein ABR567_07035 [Myxococcales bacterium]|nr:hypothetical protein [Myxococcales bacterium]